MVQMQSISTFNMKFQIIKALNRCFDPYDQTIKEHMSSRMGEPSRNLDMGLVHWRRVYLLYFLLCNNTFMIKEQRFPWSESVNFVEKNISGMVILAFVKGVSFPLGT